MSLMTMEKMTFMTKIVFFDTDCISSFLWTKTEHILIHCFGNDMIIPKQVYVEISLVPHLKQRIDTMVESGHLVVEDILLDNEEKDLYLKLTEYSTSSVFPIIGRGEAGAIVLAKMNDGILASNNLRDVKYYVELFKLNHITTADIIQRAVDHNVITEDQANQIWAQMVAKRRKLPFQTYTDYLNSL